MGEGNAAGLAECGRMRREPDQYKGGTGPGYNGPQGWADTVGPRDSPYRVDLCWGGMVQWEEKMPPSESWGQRREG